MLKFVAIDVGSNAMRLVLTHVFEGETGPSFKRETLLRVPVRLGEDVFTLGHISEYKAHQLLKAMQAFRHLIDVFEPHAYMACATSAMRDAPNGPDLIAEIQELADISLQIIQGGFEAELIFASHVAETLDPQKNYLYIDVGGGSTELTIFSEGQQAAAESFNIGTVRLLCDQVQPSEWQRMSTWITKHCQTPGDWQGIGSGGNINKLYKLSNRKDKAYLKTNHLNYWLGLLEPLSIDQRIEKYVLKPDRADVIVPATQIYLRVMQEARLERIYVPQVGLADGMIHFLYETWRREHADTRS
ncbi:exopolyphosphatase [bacterium (Candidatus Blackallbacteria) CG17_big_fil_post_rev_8_21_14_2_50_48_46]|uniref:Exopolyphosphatase n=1 Tax=bacterium (Candidatus Blackallbacteria) CG17_big_fil_post_rev_8_21_14_2_50_48_46 TaxID=2014261 RepID=A0A2M7FZY6_9BACT|nr:MAG: exopolyphosphatase [bacterium (Candidatus Blackallbacteria) CG18_big_fil_WC_8_21_14_2_50_49_26]PIW14873.1 MAG: exopolyphosphatase [bacterium (Candidatus Blackallbacteria) CG17_big_fil_post_rev_8_21_14_2_50_48_46]PIW44440.1 MAG: exopolyphosphatase [bacterium (Candidatus Blackallbacteria) CG13_big_fil_rev_8_21_14_2_50_49_14]